MRKLSFALAAACLGIPALAYAASPHFLYIESSLSGSQVQVCFKEAGLDLGDVELVARADATAIYGCVTKSGQCVPAPGLQMTVQEAVSTSAVFTPRNGGVVSCLTLSPPQAPPSFVCVGGLTLTLLEVRYSNIQLVDVTNNSPGTPDNSSLSATLFACR